MKLQRSGLTKAEGQLWAVNEVMQEWAENSHSLHLVRKSANGVARRAGDQG